MSEQRTKLYSKCPAGVICGRRFQKVVEILCESLLHCLIPLNSFSGGAKLRNAKTQPPPVKQKPPPPKSSGGGGGGKPLFAGFCLIRFSD